MKELFLGWDVGGWNCERNPKSRDALCALAIADSGPVAVGKPWRGNLRELLVAHEGDDLVDAMLSCVGVPAEANRNVTLAIDAPLGWPRHMVALVTGRATVDVPKHADLNPYLFRAQDVTLFEGGHRPLSAVRDMIGSQSTKALHFLARARLEPSDVGVWHRDAVIAVETYPAAARRDAYVHEVVAGLLAAISPSPRLGTNAWRNDVRDAITCAVIAWLHRVHPDRLEQPPLDADPNEGFIFLPSLRPTP